MENYRLKEVQYQNTDNDFYAIYESENYTCTISYDGNYNADKEKGVMKISEIAIMMEAKNPFKKLSPMWFPTESLDEKCTSIQQPALAVRPDITEENIDEFYRIYKEAYNNMADFRNRYLKTYFPDNLKYLTIYDETLFDGDD